MSGWRDIDLPAFMKNQPDGATQRMVTKGELRAIVGREPVFGGPLKWHMSISCEHRDPTWEEIRDARYALVPNSVHMAQILPPKEDYVDVHPHTFHLWEVLSDKEIYRLERRCATLIEKNRELLAINEALEHRLGEPQ